MGLLDGIVDWVTGVLHWLFGVVAALAQTKTNGKAILGTLAAPLLPFFLNNNPLPNGFPWGTLTAIGNNPYREFPNTGVIRSYDWTISRGVIAPDGYERAVLLVNSAFPGPTIEANWGDTIQVTVHNNITGPEEGTSIHWHGFLQKGTPWEDGVPGVSQCPITPGKSFTYQFRASLYGTSWYHAHYSAQYAGGVVGPIVVYGPKHKAYDIDIGPVMLSDWYHKDYFTILKNMLSPGASPRVVSDNNLINGKMNFDCSTVDAGDTTKCTNSAGISKFKFKKGKTHRIRLINSGAEGVQRFSIDEHTMTVIANDFVPIEPYDSNVVTLGVGQRVDVLVKANVGTLKSAYWIRSNLTSCSPAKQPYAVAAVYYDSADTNTAPTSKPWDVPDPGNCANDDLSLTHPLYKIPLPQPSFTHDVPIDLFLNESNIWLWKLDNVSFRGDYNSPPLLLANQGNVSFPKIWNTRNTYTNSSIRMVVLNNTPAPHPIHLHGANMYILHEGDGAWDGTSIVNASNPMRRDVQMVRPGGHLVVQFDSDNPGVWPFHCHVAWHAAGGLFMEFVVQPDKIKQMQIPSTVAQTCRDWAAWTKTNIPEQIDSGP